MGTVELTRYALVGFPPKALITTEVLLQTLQPLLSAPGSVEHHVERLLIRADLPQLCEEILLVGVFRPIEDVREGRDFLRASEDDLSLDRFLVHLLEILVSRNRWDQNPWIALRS